MKKLSNLMLLALIGCISAGCSSFGPEKSLFGAGRVTTASANQIFDENFEAFTDEQLIQLLDPRGNAQGNKSSDGKNKDSLNNQFSTLNASEKFERLTLAFLQANDENSKARRSQIQDRLIAASNQRCNIYTTYLKRISEYTNGIFGVATTVLGGAGAIVTGANSARLLSGLAGISSGTRAELNQAVFESLASSVIVPAIQKTREAMLKEIIAKRQDSLEEYTVEGAVADAIRYHGACSMDTGIAYAGKSIQAFADLGPKKLEDVQKELEKLRSSLAKPEAPPAQ